MIAHIWTLLSIVLQVGVCLFLEQLTKPQNDRGGKWYKDNLYQKANESSFLDTYIEMPPPPPQQINKVFHFIRHTHTDPGWVETMKYYMQTKVAPMLEDGIPFMAKQKKAKDPRNKFTFANADFIKSFWEREPSFKQPMIDLIKSGEFEVLNDGIVMPDQGCTYFDDLINVYEYGREFMNKHFGKMTRVGWSIDAFGLSQGHSRLLSDMGYEHQTACRARQDVMAEFSKDGNMLFDWKQHHEEYNMATMMLANHYNTPGFHGGKTEKGNQHILSTDFESLHDGYRLYSIFGEISLYYKQKNLMIPLGDDFAYVKFEKEMKIYDRLINIFLSNQHSAFRTEGYYISTVNEYFSELGKEKEASLLPTTYRGDLVPMANFESQMGNKLRGWGAVLFGRPNLKQAIKDFGQVVRGLTNWAAFQVLSGKYDEPVDYESLTDLRFVLGIMSHHDAITGTCFNSVERDYFEMIRNASKSANSAINPILKKIAGIEVNISLYQTSARISDRLTMLLNQDIPGVKTIRVSVPKKSIENIKVSIVGVDRNLDERTSVVCALDICEYSVKVEFDVFEAKLLRVSVDEKIQRKYIQKREIKNEYFDCSSEDAVKIDDVIVGLGYYSTSPGTMIQRMVAHVGTYAMLTYNDEPLKAQLKRCRWHKNTDGSIVVTADIEQPVLAVMNLIIEDGILSTVEARVAKNIDHNDLDIFLSYQFAEFDNSTVFSTDTNGLDCIPRKFEKDYRKDLNIFPTTRIARLTSKSQDLSASILVDRSQGSSSPRAGLIELYFYRNVFGRDELGSPDSSFGIEPVSVRHRLVYRQAADGVFDRSMQVDLDSPVLYLTVEARNYGESEENIGNMKVFGNTEGRNRGLEKMLRVMLDVRESGIMMRVYNMHDTENVTIPDIKEFVKQRYGVEKAFKIEERSLDYNQPIETILNQPYLWRNVTALKKAHAEEVQGNRITLKPLTMKTFRISIAAK